MRHKTFSLSHTHAKWYRENRRSQWYIKNNMPDITVISYAMIIVFCKSTWVKKKKIHTSRKTHSNICNVSH